MATFPVSLLPNFLLSFEGQRKKCVSQIKGRANNRIIKEFLTAPLPSKNLTIKETPILALDFETTGLNPTKDQLLSIGCIEINQGKIQLSSSHHQIIKTSGLLQRENVMVHQITDQEKNQGEALNLAIEHLLERAKGKILLVHFAKIEQSFLQQACKQLYNTKPPLLMMDTLAIIKRRFDLSDVAYDPSRLRLVNLRRQFQLPTYHAHNALNDAIATAELFIAELNHNHRGLKTKWTDLIG